MFSGCPSISHSVRPIPVKTISQECLEGIFSNFVQIFTWTDSILVVKGQRSILR